ncbi:MAG: hypothetical protein ACW98I_18115 [Candidatus Hodarchaeales archaeon]
MNKINHILSNEDYILKYQQDSNYTENKKDVFMKKWNDLVIKQNISKKYDEIENSFIETRKKIIQTLNKITTQFDWVIEALKLEVDHD